MFRWAILIGIALCVGGCGTPVRADEKPFNQEEWNRATQELLHPNPSDAKLEEVWKTRLAAVSKCTKDFIFKSANPTVDAHDLAERACQSCAREVTQEGLAFYNSEKVRMPLNTDKDALLRQTRENCRTSGWLEAIRVKNDKAFEVEEERKNVLKVTYKSKIKSAMDCSASYAIVYAGNTSETAEAIAVASFEKCKSSWSAAAVFALNIYPGLSEFDRWDALEKAWRDQGISAVVEERARLKLEGSPPPESFSPQAPQNGTGI